jgi:hypothetical protein
MIRELGFEINVKSKAEYDEPYGFSAIAPVSFLSQ